MVLERVGRLGDGARTLFCQAAVLGETFRARDLEALTDLQSEHCSALLDAAMRDGVVGDRSRPGEERYGFQDEHVREILYKSTPAPSRRRWHRTAAALAADAQPSGVAEAAHHYIAAGDVELGAAYSYRAGQAAEASAAWSDALFHYRRALGLWDMTDGHLEDRARACLRVGELIHQFGMDLHQGLRYLQRALGLLEQAGDLGGQAELHAKLGREYSRSSNLEVRDIGRAMSHFQAALRILEGASLGRERLSAIHVDIGGGHAFALGGARALEALHTGLRLAAEAGDRASVLVAEEAYGSILVATGRIGEGSGYLERAARGAAEEGLTWLSELCFTNQCWHESILHPKRLVAKAPALTELKSVRARLSVPVHVMGACAHTGDFRLGESMRQLLDRELDALGLPPFSVQPDQYGRFLLRKGHWQAAQEMLALALAWAEKSGDRSREVMIRRTIGELSLRRAEWHEAPHTLSQTVAMCREGAFALGLAEDLPLYARALVRTGRLAEAEEALREAKSLTGMSTKVWGRLVSAVAVAEGMLYGAQGRAEESDATFQDALTIAPAQALRWDETETYWLWAQAGGTVDRRQRLLAQAHAIWEELGAATYAQGGL